MEAEQNNPYIFGVNFCCKCQRGIPVPYPMFETEGGCWQCALCKMLPKILKGIK